MAYFREKPGPDQDKTLPGQSPGDGLDLPETMPYDDLNFL
jgi:hypothetical protein